MNGSIRTVVVSLKAKLEGVVDPDPKAQVEWLPLPSTGLQELDGSKENLVINLSADTETQMVDATNEGHIDGSLEEFPLQKKDPTKSTENVVGVQFAEVAVGSVQINGVLLLENGLVKFEEGPPLLIHSLLMIWVD